MALNPDPKPGRWILPLVVLGMVAFTYFFVRALPGEDVTASPDTSAPTATSTPEDTGDTSPSTDTTTPAVVDPAAQAYLDGVGEVLTGLEGLQREMSAVNGGFDADPRTVEYSDAVDRLKTLATQADDLVAQMDTLTPPEALTTNHETIRTAVVTGAAAAEEAVAGLQSTDDGSQRRNAVAAFDQAVSDLQTAVTNARSAAGVPTTTPTTTGDTTDTTEGNSEDG